MIKSLRVLGDLEGKCQIFNCHKTLTEVWNSFPADIQDIFIDLAPFIEEESIKWDIGIIETAKQFATELGHPIYSLTDAEHQQWRDAVQYYHDEWIAETEAEGLPAREVYEGAKKLIAEYSE